MAQVEDTAEQFDAPASERLAAVNALLAEWAACSAVENAPLIERLERMGYEVRDKSREDVAETLKHPPTRASSG